VPHARESPIRFLLLAILIFVAFANEYAFNNPQALEDSMEKILDISESQFQLFYSLYALPNVVTLLIIGYLCDRFGVRLSLISLSAGVAFCQLIIAIGGYIKSYPLILVGRILFGIASEALFIPHASMISLWFQGTEQAFALGIGITFPELGNAFNSFMTPLIFEHSQNLGNPLLFSFGLCLVGLLMACLAAYLDKRADWVPLALGRSTRRTAWRWWRRARRSRR
jgi:MFS family permease